MNGLDLKFTLSTKIKYLDFIVGSMFLPGVDEGAWAWVPGSTNSYDYKLNGGGVYAGISPKLKGKNIGLTSEFAIGVFSFKEYLAIFNNRDEPYIDAYEKKTSHGLGAMSSIGIYLKFGKLGVNPTVNAVFSGSSSASFMFYGFVLPLTLQF
jgi:hypothetical protein